MIEDSVQSLEKLAEMHRRGDLSDAEFAEAKRGLLRDDAAEPAATVAQWTEPASNVLAVSPMPTGGARRGAWKLAVIAFVVLGFVLGIAAIIVAEVAPSSAQWTKGFVCAGGEQLVTNGGVVHSNGGSAQGATHFYCAPGGQPVTGFELLSLPEKTGSVLGLSLLLGFLVAAVLTSIAAITLRVRSRARPAPG